MKGINDLYYKPGICETVERHRLLWSGELQDRILVKINISKPQNYTAVEAMSKVPDFEKMLEEWEKGFNVSKEIDDDSLPVLYGELGSYIIGGFFGAKVRWGVGGAYSEPLIKDINNFEKYLNFSEDNEYYKLQISYLNFLKEKSKDKFGFTEMLSIDGLNFLDCMRGVNAYTDILDFPKKSIDLMDIGSEFNIKFIKKQRKLIKPFKNGRFNFYQIWTPNETIFLSVDAYGHCGPEIFEKFGRKYLQNLIDEFNGGWLHVHSDAHRLLPNYVKLKNLIAIGLEDWIKPPRMIKIINEIKEIVCAIPLMININKDELIQRIKSKSLPGNILYWVNNAESIKEANQIAEMCKSYLSPFKKNIKFVKN